MNIENRANLSIILACTIVLTLLILKYNLETIEGLKSFSLLMLSFILIFIDMLGNLKVTQNKEGEDISFYKTKAMLIVIIGVLGPVWAIVSYVKQDYIHLVAYSLSTFIALTYIILIYIELFKKRKNKYSLKTI